MDRLWSADAGDGIAELLERSDYVVLCCELNDETWHIINENALSRMKKDAVLVNIGRGALVDERALYEALQTKQLRAAGLDTTEIEPLPADSPLWTLPNIMITPHTTPQLPDQEERSLGYVLKNIEAYRRGEGFVNRLTERDLYQRPQTSAGCGK